MLRKIFGAKRDEIRGEWRKLHNAALRAFYSCPNIIRTRRTYGTIQKCTQNCSGKNLMLRDLLGGQGIDGRTILKWI